MQTKTVVTADVLGSGVVDAEDGDAPGAGLRQPGLQEAGRGTRRSSRTGSAMTMGKDGDRWLVDNVKSY